MYQQARDSIFTDVNLIIREDTILFISCREVILLVSAQNFRGPAFFCGFPACLCDVSNFTVPNCNMLTIRFNIDWL